MKSNILKGLSRTGSWVGVNEALSSVYSEAEAVHFTTLLSLGSAFTDSSGWFFRTRKALAESTGISHRKQRYIEQKLIGSGVLSVDKRGALGNNYYRLNSEELIDLYDNLRVQQEDKSVLLSAHKPDRWGKKSKIKPKPARPKSTDNLYKMYLDIGSYLIIPTITGKVFGWMETRYLMKLVYLSNQYSDDSGWFTVSRTEIAILTGICENTQIQIEAKFLKMKLVSKGKRIQHGSNTYKVNEDVILEFITDTANYISELDSISENEMEHKMADNYEENSASNPHKVQQVTRIKCSSNPHKVQHPPLIECSTYKNTNNKNVFNKNLFSSKINNESENKNEAKAPSLRSGANEVVVAPSVQVRPRRNLKAFCNSPLPKQNSELLQKQNSDPLVKTQSDCGKLEEPNFIPTRPPRKYADMVADKLATRTPAEQMKAKYGDFSQHEEIMALVAPELVAAEEEYARIARKEYEKIPPDEVFDDYPTEADDIDELDYMLQQTPDDYDELDTPVVYCELDFHDPIDCWDYEVYLNAVKNAQNGVATQRSEEYGPEVPQTMKNVLRADFVGNRTDMLPKPRRKEVKVKMKDSTIEIIQYWNSKPQLVHHKLNKTDDTYYQVEQSNGVRGLTRTLNRLCAGTLYTEFDDIVQTAWRTQQWTMDDVRKAIDRIAVDSEGRSKKPSLFNFFICIRADVYPDKNRTMYRYKYPFLCYVNGVPDKAENKIANTIWTPCAAVAQKTLEGTKGRFTPLAVRELHKATKICFDILMQYKDKLKMSEEQILSKLPGMFCACYESHSASGDLTDLWYVAKYKFEAFLLEKRYV
jgi:hypothetical protein